MTRAEEYIKNYTRNCSNKVCYEEGIGDLYEPWLTPDDALCAVEIAKEEMTEKACEYIDGLIEILNDRGHGLKKERIIGGLKQAMK